MEEGESVLQAVSRGTRSSAKTSKTLSISQAARNKSRYFEVQIVRVNESATKREREREGRRRNRKGKARGRE